MHELAAPAFNFVIFAGLMTYLLRKPLKGFVANRQQGIKTQVEEAQNQKLEAERRYREFNDKLKSFEAEAQTVLARAQQDADLMRAKIIKDAQATAERIVRDAEATAQSNLQEYKDQIRRETIDKAVALAERIIRERLSSDDQRRIVNEYVGKVQ